MSNVPEMKPSAEERAKAIATAATIAAVNGQGPGVVERISVALETAFRDGALAERERIVAWLREGDETLYRHLADSIRATAMALDGVATSDDYAVIAVGAIANRIASEGKDDTNG